MADTIYVAQTPTGSLLDASTHHLGMEIAATANGYNLFPLSSTPTTHTDTNAVEVGVKFTATTPGTINGIRFYKTSLNTGTHIGSLWTSAGVLLAQATFTGETATGWQQVLFGTPVTITPGTTYIASYFAPVGRYARNASFFTTAYARGPLTAPSGTNGVFRYTAVPAFPSNSSMSSNYWVDVVFVPTALRKVTGGRAYVHADGRPTTFFWQLWRASDQVLLAEVNLNNLPAAPAGWLSFTSADFAVPGDVNLSATESYVVNVFTDGGRYVFTDDGSETLPIGTGVVLATTARSGVGQAQGAFPATTSVAYYFADVTVDVQLSTGTLDVTLPAFEVEATGEATAAGTLDVILPAAVVDMTGTVETTPMVVPTGFFAAVTGVSACIVAELEQGLADGLATLGVPGRVVPLVPGSEIPWDGCECGQLAQAVEHGPYLSNFAFPDEDNGIFGNCRLDGLAVRVRVSLTRCQYHPCPDEQGHPPTAAAQLAAGQMQQTDERLMRRAISCCLAGMRADRLIDDYAMGGSDYAVNGCCGEVSMLYWIQLV